MSIKPFRFDYLLPCYESVLVYAESLEEARFKQQRHASSSANRTINSDVIVKPLRVAGDATELKHRSEIAGATAEKKLLRSELIVLNSQFETGYQEAGTNG